MLSIRSKSFFALIVFIFSFSSCGIVSQSRYGNGFSLDLFESKAKGFDSARLHELRPKCSRYKSKKTSKGISLSQTEMQDSFQNEVKEGQQNDKKAFVTSKRIVKKQEELLQKHSQSMDMVDVIEEPPLLHEKGQKKSEDDNEVDSHSTVAFILFFSSLLLLLLYPALGLLGLMLAIGFSISSLVRISQAEKNGKKIRGKSAAVVVLVLSSLILLLFILFIILIFLALSSWF